MLNNKKPVIAIISIENKGVVTEGMYYEGVYRAKKSERVALKYSECAKSKMGISDVLFYSVDFDFEEDKIIEILADMSSTTPKVSKLFIICDRDKNFPIEKMRRKVNNIRKIAKDNNVEFENNVELLAFKRNLDKFEHFLALHHPYKKNLYIQHVNKLSKDKTDSQIFKKMMGKDCKNYGTLLKNLKNHQPEFLKLFKDHSKKL